MRLTTTMLAVTLLMLAVLISCDSQAEWSSDEYAVYWIDQPDNRMLGRKLDSGNFIGRVEAILFAVGENEKWVVAARRDARGGEFFYYILKSQDTDFKNGSDVVQGPYERMEFERRRSKYNLPKFDRYF